MASGFLSGLFGDKSNEQIDQIMEILDLIKKNNDLIDNRLDSLQEMVLKSATIVAQHKQVIDFLLKNSSFDAYSKKDLVKMLKNINDLNEKVKK